MKISRLKDSIHKSKIFFIKTLTIENSSNFTKIIILFLVLLSLFLITVLYVVGFISSLSLILYLFCVAKHSWSYL